MRKAISEVIVAVMILMIAVSLVGVAYVFMSGFQEQTKTEVQQTGTEAFKKMGSCLQIVSFDNNTNNLWVKNCGRYDIDNVTVFIDGKPMFPISVNAKQNEIKSIALSAAEGAHEIKIVSDYASAKISITIRGLIITFEVKSNAGESVAKFSSSGNITLKGTCTASANCIAPADAPFIIQNPAADTVSYIDNFGNLCVEDSNCNDNDANCDSPGDNSFIIQNGNGANVAYINSTGSLCLKGSLIQNGMP